MRACLTCGDVFKPGSGPARLKGWYCASCNEREAWFNLKQTALRLQAEERHALACYRPEALVTFGSATFDLKPVALVGHEHVARVGFGGAARWRSTS